MQYSEEQYSDHIKLSTWKKLLPFVFEYKKEFYTLVISMSLLAVCDVLLGLASRFAIDNFVVPNTTEGLGALVVAYILLIILATFSGFTFIKSAGRLDYHISYSMRKEGFKRLQGMPFSFYDKIPAGSLISRLTSDVSHLGEGFAWHTVDIIWAIAYIIASMMMLFIMDSRLSLIILMMLPPLAVISYYFQKQILKRQREVRKTNSRIISAFNEGIMGATTTKTLVREQKNEEEFEALTSHMRKSSISSARMSSIYLPIVIFVSSIAAAYVLSRGSGFVLKGSLTLGTLTAFFNFTLSMFEPIHSLASIFSEMQRMQAAAERVVALLETEPDIKDNYETIEAFGDIFNPKKENWPQIYGDVEFRNVSFKYKDGEQVLENFCLHVPQGKTVALVGPTGAGKSTIVNLLCRFYEPTSGSILIDGVDYKKRSQLWLQSSLGYVLQEPHLFSGTVKDNIRYSKKDASDEEVYNAARLVHADSFIERLENKYDTQVGESGNRLSTGEKQLISFARAIIHDPRIFVLDEATSSVDTETESAIKLAIEKTLIGRTSFIIAHRLSTIRNADIILVIDDGKIAEKGNHEELMEKQGMYYKLYTNQFQDEIVMKALRNN
ncbi:MAG TPA: ABC transporter ATP-binding protein [Christensenellaceae bacterium]|jgi:ATP-binding cassette subfamily B protein|nr:ABC transporter ATP-binding protein [Christensenellaceae bacterium]